MEATFVSNESVINLLIICKALVNNTPSQVIETPSKVSFTLLISSDGKMNEGFRKYAKKGNKRIPSFLEQKEKEELGRK